MSARHRALTFALLLASLLSELSAFAADPGHRSCRTSFGELASHASPALGHGIPAAKTGVRYPLLQPMLREYLGETKKRVVMERVFDSGLMDFINVGKEVGPVTYLKAGPEREATRVFALDRKLYYTDGVAVASDSLAGIAKELIYVMDSSGNFYIRKGVKHSFHHSSFLAGEPVAAAGTVWIKDGKLLEIDCYSGHYAPSADHLLQALQELAAMGIELNVNSVEWPKTIFVSPADKKRVRDFLESLPRKQANP